jgi:hypothetical protein
VTTEGEEDVQGMPRQVAADAVPGYVVLPMNVVEEHVARTGPKVTVPAGVARVALMVRRMGVRGWPAVTPWRVGVANAAVITPMVIVTAVVTLIVSDVLIRGSVHAAENVDAAASPAVGIRVTGGRERRAPQGGDDERCGDQCVFQHREPPVADGAIRRLRAFLSHPATGQTPPSAGY